MRLVSIQNLLDRTRLAADMAKSSFVKDPEAIDRINTAITELHDLMIAAYDADYFYTTMASKIATINIKIIQPTVFFSSLNGARFIDCCCNLANSSAVEIGDPDKTVRFKSEYNLWYCIDSISSSSIFSSITFIYVRYEYIKFFIISSFSTFKSFAEVFA
ncbi:hypothetical protein LCGC14_2863130 [marine sediment metagenome]|uniref:Uncharacterized protein n=1 Tax=marine sediment metagenome TaxID=412755 RepID=A0A0F8Y502_9ZZZZ